MSARASCTLCLAFVIEHAPAKETALVPDPFYPDIAAFATIPRAELASFLRHAARNGATVILDIHAFPGGSQQGTYNGIWPNRPAFWTENSKVGNPVPLTEVGRWIVQALIQWAETLDPEAKKGIKGLTLMNEPAHFNAWTHFAQEDDVLSWLSEAADDFRKSMLPAYGLQLGSLLCFDHLVKLCNWPLHPPLLTKRNRTLSNEAPL